MFKGSWKLPVPVTSDSEFGPCGAYYRDGKECGKGADCEKDHIPIGSMTRETRRAWVQHVKKTKNMRFTENATSQLTAELNLAPEE